MEMQVPIFLLQSSSLLQHIVFKREFLNLKLEIIKPIWPKCNPNQHLCFKIFIMLVTAKNSSSQSWNFTNLQTNQTVNPPANQTASNQPTNLPVSKPTNQFILFMLIMIPFQQIHHRIVNNIYHLHLLISFTQLTSVTLIQQIREDLFIA